MDLGIFWSVVVVQAGSNMCLSSVGVSVLAVAILGLDGKIERLTVVVGGVQ